MSRYIFQIGNTYKREDVSLAVGDGGDISGNWATGYPNKDGVTFIFANVGNAGQTGHDYENYFLGEDFVWRGRTGSARHHPTIREMTAAGAEVHIFWRSHGRAPFTYAGQGQAYSVSDSVPVEVRWKISLPSQSSSYASKAEIQLHTPGPSDNQRPNATQRMLRLSVETTTEQQRIQVSFDAEALSFVEGYKNYSNRFQAEWLPSYKKAITVIATLLDNEKFDQLYEIVWKAQDNNIAHAGFGLLKHSELDSLREELNHITQKIQADPSAANFGIIIDQFRKWRADNKIEFIPWLLLARAFSAIHPQTYHTTVDNTAQARVLKWFAIHTGFTIPKGSSWPIRAAALTLHLKLSGFFDENEFSSNLFPWFVHEQIQAHDLPSKVKPGHKPRLESAYANIPESQRNIELRHNALQTKLFSILKQLYGNENVWTEYPTGTGGYADAVIRNADGKRFLYEIKIAETASAVIRQAMGQLLEYSFRAQGLEPVKLIAVGEHPLDDLTMQFLDRLKAEFALPLEYLQVTLD